MKKKKRQKGVGCAFFPVAAAFILLLILLCVAVARSGKISPRQTIGKAGRASGISKIADVQKGDGSLYSKNAILIRLSDNSVLLEKNADDKIYPASLTKLMTAVVALENIHNLQTKITLPKSAFSSLAQSDASMAGFEPDESATAEDLLYGALLPSGAECCIGLADYVSGSETAFVARMNNKAAALGMSGTHFMNVTGLQNEKHYTTARDLGVLLRYALKNRTFRNIFTSPRHTVSATNKHPNGFTFHSTLFDKLKNPAIGGGAILGGKTGYTQDAGLCLASLAQKNGVEYILVTAGARGNHDTEQYDVEDAIEAYSALP